MSPEWPVRIDKRSTNMVAKKVQPSTTADREIVISRLLDAPLERVWDAWIDPKAVAQWFGPNGFTITTHEMDVRPGGVWRFTMHGPDGVDYRDRVDYSEVVQPERLVYVHSGDDDPNRFDVTVTFELQGGKTLLTMRSVFATAEERARVVREVGAIEGGKQTLARLAEYVEQMA
jgi:uncharacterized protein YndB with AHSA1/START domain